MFLVYLHCESNVRSSGNNLDGIVVNFETVRYSMIISHLPWFVIMCSKSTIHEGSEIKQEIV